MPSFTDFHSNLQDAVAELDKLDKSLPYVPPDMAPPRYYATVAAVMNVLDPDGRCTGFHNLQDLCNDLVDIYRGSDDFDASDEVVSRIEGWLLRHNSRRA